MKRSILKPFEYPKNYPFKIKTYSLKLQNELQPELIILFQSFENKNLYYIFDDIFYLLNSKPNEYFQILNIILTLVLAICNNNSVNLFDIWIYKIYVNQTVTFNKFINDNVPKLNYMVIELAYK